MTNPGHFVLVKLITGEQLMAILSDEDENAVQLTFPMEIKSSATGHGTEQLTAVPYCTFVQERIFEIDKINVMFINELHEMVIDQYIKMIEAYEEEVEVEVTENGDLRQVGEPTTAEDLKTRVSILTEMVREQMNQELEDEVEPSDRFFVQGNDTIN